MNRAATASALIQARAEIETQRAALESIQDAYLEADKQCARFEAALHKIVYEPIGDPLSTDRDLLMGIAAIARDALNA